MPELSTAILVSGGKMLRLTDGTMLPTRRAMCPECERINGETVWQDMGSRVRYRLICPKGHEWEILP